MSNGLEAVTVAQFLWETLTDDPQIMDALGGDQERIAHGTLPMGVDLPGIRYTVHNPQDVKVVGMTQVFSQVRFDLIVTTEGQSFGPCIPIYERAHLLLDGKTNQPTDSGLVLTCSRVSGIIYPERDNGVEYRHLGGTYAAEAN